MEKLVIYSRKPLPDSASIVREIGKIPGVAVTSVSPSFIDVQVERSGSGATLRNYAERHGLAVEATPEPELMEPMSPFSAL